MSEKAPFLVFSGTNSRYLAEKICASLNCPLGKMNITHFADGEFAVSYEESGLVHFPQLGQPDGTVADD